MISVCFIRFTAAFFMLSVPFFTAVATAASFEIATTPSRFELASKSPKRLGQSLDLNNLGSTATEVSVRTLDWRYSPEGGVTYFDELLEGSCRPWVVLERKTVKIAARSKTSFRFQIEVPEGAPRGECRFMLAIEGVEPAYKALIEGGGASLSLPVSGRIAIAVYLAVNGAEPKLEISQIELREINGQRTPVVTIKNTGDAHGRLDGSLDAVDAKGVQFEWVPEGTPIMPGQTRNLPLSIRTEPNQRPPSVVYPVKSSGTLDWEKGSFKVNAELK